jgi:hypothetical protein
MFCPKCHAEYRQGFTRCADCNVELVQNLSHTEDDVSNARHGGTLEPLWEGEDLALHSTLLQELELAGIRYFDEAMSVYPGARRGDYFPIQPMTQFGYQVAVLSSDLTPANRILERLLKEKPQDTALPPSDEEQAETPGKAEAQDKETTREIWAGSDQTLRGFLVDALRENNIGVRMEAGAIGAKVYVCPSDEGRAREIVREIVEGAPPQ